MSWNNWGLSPATPYSPYQQNLTVTVNNGPLVNHNPFSNLMTPPVNPYPMVQPFGWNPYHPGGNPWNPWNPGGGGSSGGGGGGSNGPVLPNAPRNFEFNASAVSALLNEADALGNGDGELSKRELNAYIRQALRSGREDGTRLTTQEKQILAVVKSKFDNIADSKIVNGAYTDDAETIQLGTNSDVHAAALRNVQEGVGRVVLSDEDLATPAVPPAPAPATVVVENGNQRDTSTSSGANYQNTDDSDIVTIGSGSSNNLINTSAEADTITVSGSFQTVNSGAGNDNLTIDGTTYGSIDAGTGDDTLTVKNSASWTRLAGGAGNDTVEFEMSSSEFHVRDDGNTYGFIQSNGTKIIVDKDIENFTFSDGKTFTKAQLDALITNNQGNLAGNSVKTDATAAVTLNGGTSSLNLGTQLNDTITTNGNVTTVNSGAGNDTVTVNGNFHNVVDSGDGDDTVTLGGDWVSSTSLGNGNDSLHLTDKIGGGNHDAGAGDDTLILDGTQFTISQSGNRFVIRGANGHAGSSSKFSNFETFKLGDQTFTAAELATQVTEAGGKLLLGAGNTGHLTSGTDAVDTLTVTNGQNQTVEAKSGNDTLNLSGLSVTGNGGEGNDVFNLTNSRIGWNRVTANGGNGDDIFNVTDNTNRTASNLHTLIGGAGNDTVNFAMNANQYRVRDINGNAVTLVDIQTGALTQLRDVETLKFADNKQYTLQQLQERYNEPSNETLRFQSFELGF